MLGAGGVAGHAFHAGVLRALADEAGWDARQADLVIGTSAGSVVGLGIRAGLSPTDVYARVVNQPMSAEGDALLARIPPSEGGPWRLVDDAWRLPLPPSPGLLARIAIRPWRARPGLFLAGLLPAGRFDISRIARDADALVASTGNDLGRFWVTAVRLSDGRRVVFGREGELASETWTWGQAVAASCAIPGFFSPVLIGNERYVDGGAHSPTNAHLAGAVDPDLVIVRSPMSSIRTAGRRSLDAPVRAAYRLRLATEVARLRRRGVPVVVFQPTAEVLRAAGLNAMDPQIGIPVAEASYAAAARRCRRPEFAEQAGALAP